MSYYNFPYKCIYNKKVLLSERKRHTDRGVSSTPSVILYEVRYPPRPGLTGGNPRWGTPCLGTPWPGLMGGTPQPGLTRGTQGTPRSDLAGLPPIGPCWGTSPSRGTPVGPGKGIPPSVLAGVPPVWTWPRTPSPGLNRLKT